MLDNRLVTAFPDVNRISNNLVINQSIDYCHLMNCSEGAKMRHLCFKNDETKLNLSFFLLMKYLNISNVLFNYNLDLNLG